ncbi:MAG: hypothetical protein H0U99_08450, partial [Chthoniobacterales bacterium]|nr:hypothetical protein [Chthoniobacterales bacterium]
FREQPQVAMPDGMYFSAARGSVRKKLARQAAEDWRAFLQARAQELVPGGQMMVQGIATVVAPDGSEQASAARLLQLMWEVARTLVEDGHLDGRVLVSYIFPVYCRSKEEALAPMTQGGPLAEALEVVSAETSAVANPYWEEWERNGDAAGYARSYTAFVRAFAESTLAKHLFASAQNPEELGEEFFRRLEEAIRKEPERGKYEATILRVVMRKKVESRKAKGEKSEGIQGKG